jgi:hypothetical protein
MPQVTIAGQTVPNYYYEGTLHEFWVFSDRSWVAEDGVPIQGRGQNDAFVAKYTVTVVGTNASIPNVILYAQSPANVKNARYTAYFYVDGIQKDQFLPNSLGNFIVPAAPTSTTWKDLEIVNTAVKHIPNDDRVYTVEQVNTLLADIVAGAISGPASGPDLTGSYPGPQLTATGVSANTYGDATHVPALTVDAKGRLSAVVSTAITGLVNALSQTFAGVKTFTNGIISDVTGNLTGNVTGAVTGNVTGNVTGDTTGTHNGPVVLANGQDIAAGTGSGTKVGSSSSQKLGFWGHSPVAQQILATGAAHTVDDVITSLQAIGLFKQS